MRIRVDRTLCQGHARCWSHAPDLMTLDDEGYVMPGDIEVPEGAEALGRRAVLSCPERALRLEP